MIAVEFDGLSEPTEHVPEKWIPRGDSHGEHPKCEQRWVPTTNMLLLVSNDELLFCSIKPEDPLRNENSGMENTTHQRSCVSRNGYPDPSNLAVLRIGLDSAQA
jgi:hypothetical protein